ncbi:hypothetical protein WR25_22192 [Diploscapter pachys]|uniref:Exonuclease domain-containing protein n=1 Tax=Diploscapter pachys TaxID=2018661 RepID=A0A2A2KBT3_9BILA|nr:hypothetical protein WR25_22192 [Diploscapter pachys]
MSTVLWAISCQPHCGFSKIAMSGGKCAAPIFTSSTSSARAALPSDTAANNNREDDTLTLDSGIKSGHSSRRFVRPRRRPQLTPFCCQLTHIAQADVDGAEKFDLVWRQFEQWLQPHQAQLHAWLPHINLKQRFAKARHLQRPAGLNSALQLAGLQFSGQQHRALEDARNTARLLPSSLPPGTA